MVKGSWDQINQWAILKNKTLIIKIPNKIKIAVLRIFSLGIFFLLNQYNKNPAIKINPITGWKYQYVKSTIETKIDKIWYC